MRTKTQIKLVRNLTPDEYRKCKSLNFRYNGCMMYDLPMAKKKYPTSRVVMIKDAETDMLIAWCLAIPSYSTGQYVTQYYVRVKFRRRGFGDRLIKNVRKFEPSPVVMPHDRPSRGFFRKHQQNVIVNNSYSL